MIGPGRAGLAALALGLCGLIGLELAGRDGGADASLVQTAPIMPAGTPIAAVGPSTRGEVRLGAVLARPLFSPDRRPAASSGARSVSGLPRLSGIIVTGGRKVAIFAAPGKPIVAEEGLRIGVYDVTAISNSGVTVAGPEGTTVLRPLFDPGPPAAVAKGPVMQRPVPPPK
jgi:hypothetical protein